MAVYVPPRAEKAALGPGVISMTYDRPAFSMASAPQKLAVQAQALYHTNPWVHAAEKAVSGRGGSVDWHLEDENDDEIDDESAARYAVVVDLLEKPQAQVADIGRKLTRRELWTLTLRHMGLCGTSFWYLDQTTALTGIPLGIVYINPARMWPAIDKQGNLLGWSLDGEPGERGAMPLELDEVLPFYLDPPDNGHLGIGLVESVGMKAHLSSAADRYIANTLDNGGRLAGIVSPKPNVTITDDQWNQFVRDARQIADDPQSAKRLQAVRGPIDFSRTSATPQELTVTEVASMSRDDILALWNVPGSQIGLPINRALGQNSAQSFEEAVLWQNAIGPRLTAFYETVQYGLLDRFAKMGLPVELVLDVPSFDDDAPKYDLAQKAAGQPLTRNERRAILGLEPLPDWTDTGEPLGIAIDMPIAVSVVGNGPSEEPRPTATMPMAQPPMLMPPADVEGAPVMEIGKARLSPKAAALHGSLVKLRSTVEKRVTPKLRANVRDVLLAQRKDIANRIREHAAKIAAKPSDTTIWFPKTWDAKLAAALAPTTAMSEQVRGHIRQTLQPGKAAPVTEYVVGTRVTGINERTRQKIAQAISAAIDNGDLITDVADALEEGDLSGLFDDYRAELIARTELMDAYNTAALGEYGDAGVTQVQAIDGDDDEECADRDGQVFDIEEADSIEDHPNGTLDWVPVL